MERNSIYETAPVATTPRGGNGGALVDIEQQRAMAEVQSAMVIAKRFPRDPVQARDRILEACRRPALAEQALYTYARGGTDISGPSIRMAEAIAQNWGNVQFGVKELDQRGGESTVQAYAWDLETNVKQEKTFQVKHKRYTKKGAYDLEDPRDIYEMTANQGARRLRACILGVIPGDVIDAAVAECESTLKAKADTSPEALKKLVAAFETYHVSKSQIEKRIQRRIDTITPAQIVALRKIYNSLKDGMSSTADWFEPEGNVVDTGGAPKGAEGLKKKLKGKATPSSKVGLFECPDTSEMISAGKCDECDKREGCPEWDGQ